MSSVFPASTPLPDIQGEALAARRAAIKILSDILDRKKPIDQALEDSDLFRALLARDRAFARMILTTALRRLGQIDDLIRKSSDRHENPSPPLLHHILRVGVTQLLFMGVPDYAAIDTSVKLTEELGLGRQKGFVNAILRRLQREGNALRSAQDEIVLNFPAWLMKSWEKAYGLKNAYEIARASLSEAPLDISLKDQAMIAYWAEQLEAAILPAGTLRRAAGGMVADLPGFHDGMWWVQDASAAIPARLFGNVYGKTVVDLCAAPGGKTAQLAAAGAQVIAVDRSTSRLKKLEENLKRLRLEKSVQIVTSDAADWKPAEAPDLILLDAPCSATGTIRRHPDILHLKSERDIAALAITQARILEQAASILKPGGLLVYCTCSLQREEGEDQIEALCRKNLSVQRVILTPEHFPEMQNAITPQGDLRILPFYGAMHGGMDGFFVSIISKQ